MSMHHGWFPSNSYSSATSSNSSAIQAREIFFMWAVSMPVGTSFAREAEKILQEKTNFWDAVPNEIQAELRDMLRQTMNSMMAFPMKRRGSRGLRKNMSLWHRTKASKSKR